MTALTQTLEQEIASRFTLNEILVWIVVGALAGSFIASLFTMKREGFGVLTNVVFGLIGAVIGGLVVEFFQWNLPLGAIVVYYEDLAAAALGSTMLLCCVWWLRTRWRAPRRRRA